jgi:hypothetical protein
MDTATKVQPVAEGDPVKVVDEQHGEHIGLVTVVHGQFTDTIAPCINVVYVSTDRSKRDPYGAQVERMSSLQHYTQGPSTMPNPGRYWLNV